MFSDTQADLNKMKKKIKENVELLKNIPSNSQFYPKLNNFYQHCSKDIDMLDKDLSIAIEKFQKMAKYYGYAAGNSKYKNPEEFFEMIDKFLMEVERYTPKTEIKKTFKGNHNVGSKVITNKNMEDIIKGIQKQEIISK